MVVQVPHMWTVDDTMGKTIQEWLKSRVSLTTPVDFKPPVVLLVSVGVPSTTIPPQYAIRVLTYTYPKFEKIMSKVIRSSGNLLYPGDLEFFGYGKILCRILSEIDKVELIIVNRPGLDHPRHFGVASHIGILTDIPTIGISNIAYGDILGDDIVVPIEEYVPSLESLVASEELGISIPPQKSYGGIVGSIVSGIAVSIGHKISKEDAVSCITHALRKKNVIKETLEYAG